MLHDDQQAAVSNAIVELRAAAALADPLLEAEHLRFAAGALGSILGVDATEAMLDALFSRFCVGK